MYPHASPGETEQNEIKLPVADSQCSALEVNKIRVWVLIEVNEICESAWAYQSLF